MEGGGACWEALFSLNEEGCSSADFLRGELSISAARFSWIPKPAIILLPAFLEGEGELEKNAIRRGGGCVTFLYRFF